MCTAAMTEVVETIRDEASHLHDFCAALAPEDWTRPSACAGWSVGDVFAHLTQGAQTWSAAITRALAGDVQPPAGEQPLRPGESGSESTARRAIALRQEAGMTALLQAFTAEHAHFHQIALTVPATDWDRPCYHRRGNMAVRNYVALRLQELTIHGWDIRSAFDTTATLSARPLPLLTSAVQRWLLTAFRPAPGLAVPVRYRFETTDPSVLQHDIVAGQEGLRLEPVTEPRADVTFRCTLSEALLLIYGRHSFDQARESGSLEIVGNQSQAVLFPTLFHGF